jgi:hypothetical protein
MGGMPIGVEEAVVEVTLVAEIEAEAGAVLFAIIAEAVAGEIGDRRYHRWGKF